MTQQSSFWLDRPVFVTGCNGLLGSWLTQALVEAGALVVGLIRDTVPYSNLKRNGTQNHIAIVHGDVTDYALIERALNEYDIETVFHLAAQTLVTVANRAPLNTFETNIKGTWTVLEAARRSPTVKRIVVASSDKAYGDLPTLPYAEDMPLHGQHPYDVSKSCADLIAQTYATTYDLPVGITRCANLFGGGDLNWNRIIPGTIRSVLRGQRPIIRSDGTPRRDFLYIRDAVSAYLTHAEQLDRPELHGRAFNYGMNHPQSVLDVVETIVRLSGRADLAPVVQGQARNEIQDQYLDSTQAHQVLGWSPRYTMEQGLEETLAWYREFLG